MKTFKKLLQCSVVVLAMGMTCLAAKADEFRALWVDAFGDGFLNASQVTKLVNDCRTYNYNAVIVQMRRRGDAFYMPQAPNGDPRTTAIAANFDALQEIINQCHGGEPRIEVHCWAPANLIWGDPTKPPTQSGHVYNLHPGYLTRTSAGATQFAEGFFLDPGHPDAMQWNYNMAMDIVSRYDVDGFHWDYIRYPQQDAGYNPTALARYNAEFGLTGQPAPSSSQFSSWRRRQVTDFLRWVNADLLEVKPSLVISASVFADRNDATNFRFQDWATWNNEGIIDLCLPMNYTTSSTTFTTRLNDAFNNQGVRRVYMGLGAYLNTKENTLSQLSQVRAKPLLGSSLFSYRTSNSGTVNQAETFEYIRDNFQPTWVSTPALPWLASPTKGIVKGTVRRSDNNQPVYNATVTLSSSPVRTQKTESHGKYALFEAPAGSFTLTASAGGFNSAPVPVTVTEGGIHTVDIVIELPANPDSTAPVITTVRSSNITSNSCVITWVTDELADSTVEYGLSVNYGSETFNASKVVNHSVSLSGLLPAATYNYRVKSKDAAGNESVSGNFQFTTAPAESDIIVDNPEAVVVGVWTTATSATDKFGADYRFRSKGTGANYLQFTPTIPVSGTYQVFQWHPQGSNRATNVPYVVSATAGEQTVFVNQQVNGGKWNFIGAFHFTAGTSGHVKITDGFTDPTAGRVVMADAVRFVYQPDQEVDDVIVDNPAAVLTGAWTLATSATDKFGADYRFRGRSPGTNFATFTPSIPVSGFYQVFEWHSQGSNRATNAPHIINFQGGSQTVSVNQQVSGGKWNLMGTFPFAAGNSGYVRITDGFTIPTNGVVMADAVKFVYVRPAAPPAAPNGMFAAASSSSQINLTWTDHSTNELNFVVARGTGAGGPYVDIATVGANVTSYTDSGLSANTAYFYVVRAVGEGGPSGNSSEASATTFPLPPAAPSGLTATAGSASEISLAWTDNAGELEMVFVIARSLSAGGPFADVATMPSRTTMFTDTGLEASTTYFYRVRARNAGGDSNPSNTAGATTLSEAPAAPSNLTAFAVSTSEIDLAWVLNSSNEESVVVARTSTLGGGFEDIATLPAGSIAYSDSGLAPHTLYFYVVRAVSAGGSVDSSMASASTLNNAPVADAGGDQSASADATCQGNVTLDGSGSSDPEGDTLSYSWAGPFGSATGVNPTVSLPLGTHIITLTVSDGFGGSSTDTVTVTVSDTTPPVLALKGVNPMVVHCHDPFTDPGAMAVDACAGDLTDSIVVSGEVNTHHVGEHTLTYTVTDADGNSATATRTVVVLDHVEPELTLLGANPMTIECHTPFVDPGATAVDACATDITLAIDVTGSVDDHTPGTYVLTYMVSDPSGNTATATRTVRVVDTTPPVLALNGDSAMTVECHSAFGDPGARAHDACSGDLTGSIVVTGVVDATSPGIYSLHYSVTDEHGNTATATRTIHVVDSQAPSLTLNGQSAMTVECHTQFVDPGATASDVCSGDLTSSIVVSGSVNANVPGLYVLHYSVADASGNMASASRSVTVVDTKAPVFNSLVASTNVLLPVNHKMIPITLSASVTDACDSTPVTRVISVTSNQAIIAPGSGNTDPDWEITGNLSLNLRAEREGSKQDRIYTVTVESVDASGNRATRSVNIIAPHDQGKSSGN